MPLALRYDASLKDSRGVSTFGLGLSANSWFSGSPSGVQGITGSSRSSGYWVVLTPSLGRDLLIHTNWVLSLHADGQVATEPLIANEQFGLGGLAGVRGYHEGEVFGDDGWRITTEQKTPYYVVGTAYRNHPLTVRGWILWITERPTCWTPPWAARAARSSGVSALGRGLHRRQLGSPVPLLLAVAERRYH